MFFKAIGLSKAFVNGHRDYVVHDPYASRVLVSVGGKM